MTALVSFLTSVCSLFVTLFGFIPASLPPLFSGSGAGAPVDSVTLPLEGGSDPWYVEHEGTWYYCYSIGEGVAVRVSDRVSTLGTGEEYVAYRAEPGTDHSWAYWAPEMYFLDGAGYIYVAACDGRNETHRMFVLKSDSPTGPYEMVGKIAPETDRWAIDGTVLTVGDERYFVWSGWEGEEDAGQNLYIAKMADPTRLTGDRVCISRPTLSWEKRGAPINEGAAALQRDGRTFLVYSASGSWADDYCLGLLTLTGDPMDPAAWAKCPVPVLRKAKTAYGPGHPSFIKGSDGADYVVYHANLISGTGWNGRTVRIQPVCWRGGFPVFGRPLPEGSRVQLR